MWQEVEAPTRGLLRFLFIRLRAVPAYPSKALGAGGEAMSDLQRNRKLGRAYTAEPFPIDQEAFQEPSRSQWSSVIMELGDHGAQ
jgi:hypothetical protein